jgi:hypothetical protein
LMLSIGSMRSRMNVTSGCTGGKLRDARGKPNPKDCRCDLSGAGKEAPLRSGADWSCGWESAAQLPSGFGEPPLDRETPPLSDRGSSVPRFFFNGLQRRDMWMQALPHSSAAPDVHFWQMEDLHSGRPTRERDDRDGMREKSVRRLAELSWPNRCRTRGSLGNDYFGSPQAFWLGQASPTAVEGARSDMRPYFGCAVPAVRQDKEGRRWDEWLGGLNRLRCE